MPKPKAPANALDVTIDSWTLRCLYNRGAYEALVQSGALVELHREDSKTSVQVYYGHRRGAEVTFVVKVHSHFRNVDGNVIESPRDPKGLYEVKQNAYYHPHSGGSPWQMFRKEPEVQFSRWWKGLRGAGRDEAFLYAVTKAYGWWRKRKCRILGPIGAYRRYASATIWKALALGAE